MKYHLFLHYGWFLQTLVKDFIRANMHTTVVGQARLGHRELKLDGGIGHFAEPL